MNSPPQASNGSSGLPIELDLKPLVTGDCWRETASVGSASIQMDDQNVFQNGFEDSSLGAAIQIDKPADDPAASDLISNSLSGLCIPKQEPATPTSPLPPDTAGTSFLRQALLGKTRNSRNLLY